MPAAVRAQYDRRLLKDLVHGVGFLAEVQAPVLLAVFGLSSGVPIQVPFVLQQGIFLARGLCKRTTIPLNDFNVVYCPGVPSHLSSKLSQWCTLDLFQIHLRANCRR